MMNNYYFFYSQFKNSVFSEQFNFALYGKDSPCQKKKKK